MIKTTLTLWCLCLSVFISAQSASNNSKLVQQAAEKQAASFLNLIPLGQEKEYGFDNRGDFSSVEIGDPYQTYFVIKDGNSLSFQETQLWRVPLVVNGNAVALLTVTVKNNLAEAVDFGAARLAQKLQEFEENHMGENNDRIIIRNTLLATDFIAPNFKALCGETNNGLTALNPNTQAGLFPISAAKNTPSVKASAFISQTLSAPIK